jgi:hypothetical protein
MPRSGSAPSSEMAKQAKLVDDELNSNDMHAVPVPAFELMDNPHVIVAPFFDIGFDIGVDGDAEEKSHVGCTNKTKHAIVVTRDASCTWPGDLDFIDALANEVGVAVECVRYREKRREERKQVSFVCGLSPSLSFFLSFLLSFFVSLSLSLSPLHSRTFY